MKAVVAAFNQEKALVGAFSVIVQPVVEPMVRFAALIDMLPGSGYWQSQLANCSEIQPLPEYIRIREPECRMPSYSQLPVSSGVTSFNQRAWHISASVQGNYCKSKTVRRTKRGLTRGD